MGDNEKKLEIRRDHAAIMEQVIAKGDLKDLSPEERANYYGAVCQSIGLNPLTKPFEYITLNNKLTLYARRDATDQLRNINKVSVNIASRERMDDLYIVCARATMPDGRTDESIGVVNIGNLKGDNLANALMKCETKAKRRVTLSICGLGLLDESEIDTIPASSRVQAEKVDATTPDLKNLPRPWPADILVRALQQQVEDAEKNDWQPDEGKYGACLGIMEKAGDRHRFLQAVFDVGSAKDLSPFQRRALTDWIKPSKDEPTDEWIPGKPSVFSAEFNAVVEARLAEEGQGALEAAAALDRGRDEGAF